MAVSQTTPRLTTGFCMHFVWCPRDDEQLPPGVQTSPRTSRQALPELTPQVLAGYSNGHSIQHPFRHALHHPNGSSASTNGLGHILAPKVTPFYRLMLSVRQWLTHSLWATSRYLSGVIHMFQRMCNICQSQCILYLRFQVQISGSDFRFRFQVQISGSDFRFRFQVQISDSDFRFRFQISDFSFRFQIQISDSETDFRL
jgi:hypothetical protein